MVRLLRSGLKPFRSVRGSVTRLQRQLNHYHPLPLVDRRMARALKDLLKKELLYE